MNSVVNRRDGFSLVECLIVLVSAAIILTIALPNVQRLQQEWTLWGSMTALEATMQWGRMHAVSSNAPLLFSISDGGLRYCWQDAKTGDEFINSVRRLTGGLKIISSPRSPLRFYQHGNAVPAGTFVIAGEAGSYSVIITPGGRIRTERN